MTHRALALLLLAASARFATAQTVTIRSIGPSEGGRILASDLTVPHHVVSPGPSPFVLPRDSVAIGTVIVLGRHARIAGTVHGDVVVVGGDAFVHPGAQVDGRVVAIGGGAYRSMLGIVRGGYVSYRDFTYDIHAVAGGYILDYRRLGAPPSPPVTLAGVYGFGIPTYDRSDGLSLSFGPAIALDSSRLQASPTLTYRSQLGRIDPAIAASFQASPLARFDGFAGRSTFTNDDWIWSDLVNSAAALGLGIDSRNWYRADRAQVVGHYLVNLPTAQIEPLLGYRAERAWSVRPGPGATGGPWSLFGRHSVGHMLRPNPRIDDGTISSALVGARLAWQGQGALALNANLVTEIAPSTPRGRGFVQTTVHGTVGFPTFGKQRFDLETHWVLTSSDTAPRQRWAYLGGSGTLPFLGLLSEGGDQLLYVQSAYSIPITAVNLPIAGQPMLQLRDVMGAAGVHRLPGLEENAGVRVVLSFLRLDAMVDPARGKVRVSVGFSMAR